MSWKDELRDIIVKNWLNKPRFTLENVYRFENYFTGLHPTNRHIRAKLRETLQYLRDECIIEFVDNSGTYKVIKADVEIAHEHKSVVGIAHRVPMKIPSKATFNVKLPLHLAARYKSRSQIAGIVSEAWAEQNLYCPACGGSLVSYPKGTRVYDFECGRCEKQYQLKSSKKPFTSWIMGAAYKTMITSVRKGKHPSFILLHYDSGKMCVKDVIAIHSTAITPNNVKARRRLGKGAQRAGWQGCVIDLSHVPKKKKIYLVRNGQQTAKAQVMKRWSAI